jgi:hypothetical protein
MVARVVDLDEMNRADVSQNDARGQEVQTAFGMWPLVRGNGPYVGTELPPAP